MEGRSSRESATAVGTTEETVVQAVFLRDRGEQPGTFAVRSAYLRSAGTLRAVSQSSRPVGGAVLPCEKRGLDWD